MNRRFSAIRWKGRLCEAPWEGGRCLPHPPQVRATHPCLTRGFWTGSVAPGKDPVLSPSFSSGLQVFPQEGGAPGEERGNPPSEGPGAHLPSHSATRGPSAGNMCERRFAGAEGAVTKPRCYRRVGEPGGGAWTYSGCRLTNHGAGLLAQQPDSHPRGSVITERTHCQGDGWVQ